jgi:DNA-binding MarR family transcriptional regulator
MNRRSNKPKLADGEITEAYGHLLALRAVAAAAINRNVTPAMLRVFCVLAEYASGKEGEDLVCWVGEHALSARLNITRQAVNRQIVNLEATGLIERHDSTGRTTRYIIDTDGLRNLETGRAGWERVEERRQHNRAIRRAARKVKS